MKYLSDYMEEKQTALFEKTRTIFAFSQKQFEEQRKNNVTYVNLGQGMLTEKPNVEEVINELDKIYKDCIKQDIEENGKEKIILRELENHEAFYVSNTEDTERKLEDYECISKEDIKRVYLENYQKYNNY